MFWKENLNSSMAKKLIMEPGDNVYFDSCVPHGGKSLGDKKAKLMVTIFFYKRNRQ